jgi:starch-binding outer membrane protein, SusD/RagB family
MKKTVYRILFSLALVAVTFGSCQKDFLDKVNPNQLSTDSYFKTEDDLVASINSSYGALQRTDLYGRKYFFFFDLLSDDIRGNDPLYADGQTLTAYTFNASSETVGDVWRGLYRGILRANITLANMTKLPSSDLLKRVEAEAHFLRGFYYFDLVANWGGVPIRLEDDVKSGGNIKPKARATDAEVWALVESELTKAEAVLPDSYTGNDIGRATKWAAKGMLGKAYLYQKKYTDAAAKFKEVINYANANPTKMGLMENYRDNFVELSDADGSYIEFNKESLFEVSFAGASRTGGFNTWGQDFGNAPGEGTFRAIEYGFTIFGNTSPSFSMVAAYPDTDPRKRLNMFGPATSTPVSKIYKNKTESDYDRTDWQHKKYSNLGSKNSSGDDVENFNGSSINIRVLRYADILLMYAEALNQPLLAGIKFDATALGAVNQVRTRVGLASLSLSTGPDLFQAIINERRLELWCEHVRRKDIVRWGIAPSVLGLKFIVGKHELLPIPQSEIDLNPGTAQNNY